mmetsp:Transcript_31340/g.89972  ORF Transcript_31340/g.89972 Transcript_31340/m.89972 type:complete len:204 (+) Transcript_31340:310-921(+)
MAAGALNGLCQQLVPVLEGNLPPVRVDVDSLRDAALRHLHAVARAVGEVVDPRGGLHAALVHAQVQVHALFLLVLFPLCVHCVIGVYPGSLVVIDELLRCGLEARNNPLHGRVFNLGPEDEAALLARLLIPLPPGHSRLPVGEGVLIADVLLVDGLSGLHREVRQILQRQLLFVTLHQRVDGLIPSDPQLLPILADVPAHRGR